MIKRLIVLAIISMALGCTHMSKIEVSEISVNQKRKLHTTKNIDKINSVRLTSGELIKFEKPGGLVADSTTVITGITRTTYRGNRPIVGEPVRIELDSVQYLYVKKPALLMTSLLVGGAVLFVAMLKAISEAGPISLGQ